MTPLSQNVTNGTTVSFHCERETGFIFWRINGTRSDDFPAASAINIGGAHTLTITEPSLEYSGTKIECVAILDSKQEVSLPATLLLQGWCTLYVIHTWYLLHMNIQSTCKCIHTGKSCLLLIYYCRFFRCSEGYQSS